MGSCEFLALLLQLLNKILGIFAQITANIHCFHHSDELIVSKEGNKVGQIQTKHPFIPLDHDKGFLSNLLQLVDEKIDQFAHREKERFVVENLDHFMVEHKAFLGFLGRDEFR